MLSAVRSSCTFRASLAACRWSGGGRLRPPGATSARRSAGAPDIPSIAETIPGYDASAWYGPVGPAGLPKPIVQRLNAELQLVLADPSVRETMRTVGLDIEAGSPEAMRPVMADPVRSGIDLMDRIGFRPHQRLDHGGLHGRR